MKLQWAQYEEESGEVDTASDLIGQVLAEYPDLLAAKMQKVELERRRGSGDLLDKLLAQYTEEAKTASVRSYFAIQHSRFTFKVRNERKRKV